MYVISASLCVFVVTALTQMCFVVVELGNKIQELERL
jgi:hypothetical protein